MLGIFIGTGENIPSLPETIRDLVRDVCKEKLKIDNISCMVVVDSQDVKEILHTVQSGMLQLFANDDCKRLVIVHIKREEHAHHLTHMRNIVENYSNQKDDNVFALCYPGPKSQCDLAILSRANFVYSISHETCKGKETIKRPGNDFRQMCMNHASKSGDVTLQQLLHPLIDTPTSVAPGCHVDTLLKSLSRCNKMGDKHRMGLCMMLLESLMLLESKKPSISKKNAR